MIQRRAENGPCAQLDHSKKTGHNATDYVKYLLESEKNGSDETNGTQVTILESTSLPYKDAKLRLEKYGLSCSLALAEKDQSENQCILYLFFRTALSCKEGLPPRDVDELFGRLFPEMVKKEPWCFTETNNLSLLFMADDYIMTESSLVIAAGVHYLLTSKSQRTRQARAQKLAQMENNASGSSSRKDHNTLKKTRAFVWEEAFKRVKVLADMRQGLDLKFNHFVGLASNLQYVEGGFAWIKEKTPTNQQDPELVFAILQYVKTMNLPPQRLAEFSPYSEDHVYQNIIEAGDLRDGRVIRLKDQVTRPVDDMFLDLRKSIQDALKSDDKLIHVFKVPAGVGKTECILDLDKVLVASPTHQLKNQIHDRFRTAIRTLPDPPEFKNKDLAKRVDYLYHAGANNLANGLIKSIGEGVESRFQIDPVDREKAANYIQQVQHTYSWDDTVITTHHRALDGYRHDTIVFDEDPLPTILMPIHELFLPDLLKIKNSNICEADKVVVMDLYDRLSRAKPNMVYELPRFAFSDYTAIEKQVVGNLEVKSSVLSFFDAEYFTINPLFPHKVYFSTLQTLPKEKKIIVLSATANEWLYRRIYGGRVCFHDLGAAEQKGSLLQDTKYTYSRQNLREKNKEALKYAREESENRLVITFKGLKDEFKTASPNLHFGNTLGMDDLKGKSLAIVGTPHVNVGVYVLYSRMLQLNLKPSDFRMSYQRVAHNGLDFKFQTFEKPELQNIQFFFIESDLKQAIGRARLVREKDANVLVFSNYPLPEAEFIERA